MNPATRKTTVLIIGGYGTFGARAARLLARDTRLRLLIGGRSLARAREFVAQTHARGTIEAVVFDRDGDVRQQLRHLQPDIVLDASGPFQAYRYGYRVVEAAIANRCHYLDLADAAEFVAGIGRFDDAARQRQVCVLSGLSTCPALSAAVVRHLTADLSRIDSIVAGIAPSPRAIVGTSLLQAIASYAGRNVTVRRNGQRASAGLFLDTRRFTIAPPGQVPLPPRTFSLIDVPDHELFAARYPDCGEIWVGAAPAPGIYHALLRGLAKCVNVGLLRSLRGFVPLMRWVMNHCRWGEHRGGMFVQVRGSDEHGAVQVRSWHLIAEGDDGPTIPVLAAQAIVQRSLNADALQNGARPADAELELTDFAPLLDQLHTCHGGRTEICSDTRPLFHRILGDRFLTLPAAIQDLHTIEGARRFSGRAAVRRGRSLPARLAAWVMGFPPELATTDVTVTMTAKAGAETWTRDFGGHRFRSHLSRGQGRQSGLLCERFGALCIGIALVVYGEILHLTPRRWSFLGVPLPRSLLPRGPMFERVSDDRFRFHVDIAMPLVGHVVTYDGWLQEARASWTAR